MIVILLRGSDLRVSDLISSAQPLDTHIIAKIGSLICRRPHTLPCTHLFKRSRFTYGRMLCEHLRQRTLTVFDLAWSQGRRLCWIL